MFRAVRDSGWNGWFGYANWAAREVNYDQIISGTDLENYQTVYFMILILISIGLIKVRRYEMIQRAPHFFSSPRKGGSIVTKRSILREYNLIIEEYMTYAETS